MSNSRQWLISGVIGFAIFYLIAGGCAAIDLGNGIKRQPEVKITPCLGISLKTIYLSFTDQTKNNNLEQGLRDLLLKNGYQLAYSPEAADLELKLECKSFARKHKTLLILLVIPFITSYDYTAYEVNTSFISKNCSYDKKYYSSYEGSIWQAIIMDLGQLKDKNMGEMDGK
jgi:hypothetical protein